MFTSRYKCKNETCDYDRFIRTRFSGGTRADLDILAFGHNQTHLKDRKCKIHQRKNHDVEITHYIKDGKDTKKK